MVETLEKSHSLDSYMANPSFNHRGMLFFPLKAFPRAMWVNSCLRIFPKSIDFLLVALGDCMIIRFKLGYATAADQEGTSPPG
ncbi:hypothetical protein ES703_108808 [subsurface metagenome]